MGPVRPAWGSDQALLERGSKCASHAGSRTPVRLRRVPHRIPRSRQKALGGNGPEIRSIDLGSATVGSPVGPHGNPTLVAEHSQPKLDYAAWPAIVTVARQPWPAAVAARGEGQPGGVRGSWGRGQEVGEWSGRQIGSGKADRRREGKWKTGRPIIRFGFPGVLGKGWGTSPEPSHGERLSKNPHRRLSLAFG